LPAEQGSPAIATAGDDVDHAVDFQTWSVAPRNTVTPYRCDAQWLAAQAEVQRNTSGRF
jgi:hypothetical protein